MRIGFPGLRTTSFGLLCSILLAPPLQRWRTTRSSIPLTVSRLSSSATTRGSVSSGLATNQASTLWRPRKSIRQLLSSDVAALCGALPRVRSLEPSSTALTVRRGCHRGFRVRAYAPEWENRAARDARRTGFKRSLKRSLLSATVLIAHTQRAFRAGATRSTDLSAPYAASASKLTRSVTVAL